MATHKEALTPFFISPKEKGKPTPSELVAIKEATDYGEGVKLAEMLGFKTDSAKTKIIGSGFAFMAMLDLFDYAGIKGAGKKILAEGVKELAQKYGDDVVEVAVKKIGKEKLIDLAQKKQGRSGKSFRRLYY